MTTTDQDTTKIPAQEAPEATTKPLPNEQPEPPLVKEVKEKVGEPVKAPRPFSAFNDSPFKPHAFQARAQLVAKERPLVIITPKAYQQMLLYVEIADKEVGWMGTVSHLESNCFLIEETFLLEQEVSAVETELSVEGCSKLADELLMRGEEGFNLINKMRFWGHSHVRMGTSPSGTDESTMLRFRDENLDWYVRGIFNKHGRAEFSVYFFDIGFAVCDVDWCVIDLATGENLTPKVTSFFSSPYRDYSYDRPKTVSIEQQAEVAMPEDIASERARKYERGGLSQRLVPSDELRAQVQAEFAAKVVDRVYSYGGFGGLFSIFSSPGDSRPEVVAGQPYMEDAQANVQPKFQHGQPAQHNLAPSPQSDRQRQRQFDVPQSETSWCPQWLRDIYHDLFN
ncbi:hypothetical protein KBI23_09455 [bacterium]|nr:hypothetical protein [bacterium]MBP9810522.1 hypothetical protein [bacterium]